MGGHSIPERPSRGKIIQLSNRKRFPRNRLQRENLDAPIVSTPRPQFSIQIINSSNHPNHLYPMKFMSMTSVADFIGAVVPAFRQSSIPYFCIQPSQSLTFFMSPYFSCFKIYPVKSESISLGFIPLNAKPI